MHSTARQPYTLELAARFDSPNDFYASRNGQPFTLLAVVNPGDDPAVDEDYGSMLRSQFPDDHTVLAWPEEIGGYI